MKISALIPVHNEEDTIGSIIDILHQVDEIDEVIVINDGSTDNTQQIITGRADRVINLKENQGKGAALQKGIRNITTDIVLFMDGDLVGLHAEHIKKLLLPVMRDEADMAVGVFDEGRGLTDFGQVVTPKLSGQRAIKFELIKDISTLEEEGFGAEISINRYVKNRGKLQFVKLPELTHVMKEEKRGFTRGFWARVKMYWEVIIALFKRNSI